LTPTGFNGFSATLSTTTSPPRYATRSASTATDGSVAVAIRFSQTRNASVRSGDFAKLPSSATPSTM
jgi:hypothetical protein